MTPAVPTTDVTAALGFILTLTSLLGSFFYVHLSNWFREILELKTKAELHAEGQSERDRQGRTECRFQLKRLLNHVPFLVSAVITAFLLILYYLARSLIGLVASPSPVWPFYIFAMNSFLLIYLGLSLYFLIFGYCTARKIHAILKPPVAPPAPKPAGNAHPGA